MGKTSRRKGASYERVVAQLLKTFWGEEFRRTPLSGGWSKKTITGDIIPVDRPKDNFPFSIECKNQKSVSIPAWLSQAKSDCPKTKLPLLMFHLCRDTDEYVCLKASDFCYLIKDFIEASREKDNRYNYKDDVLKYEAEHKAEESKVPFDEEQADEDEEAENEIKSGCEED